MKAKEKGYAGRSRWQMEERSGATFTPATAAGPAPVFRYVVTEPGDRGITVKLKVTSTAGTAEESWSQRTKSALPARFDGTFSGELTAGGKTTFNGKITFVRMATSSPGTVSYKVETVDFTTTISPPPGAKAPQPTTSVSRTSTRTSRSS